MDHQPAGQAIWPTSPKGTEHFDDYVEAVDWAQDYALANRDLMMRNRSCAVQGSGRAPAV